MACGRSRIHPVERADAAIGDCGDKALQLQPVANTRRGAAGCTSDCGQDRQREQSGAVGEFTRTLQP